MNQRSYYVEFGCAMGAYVVLLLISILLLQSGLAQGLWRIPTALLPMLAGAAICWTVLRQLGRLDELQRRLQLEALSVAFAGTALITFSYGFLEGVGFPRLPMFAVWPVMAVLWIGGLLAGRRRFR
ncbi:hypothetical protein ACFOD4_03055 [Pseudoroseomonas globiformis]|uniref:Transmembrane protein n=1 Tax=Teichococcus globiformis TaxID=2307229 RepID=A0ABV7FXC9_9PROT